MENNNNAEYMFLETNLYEIVYKGITLSYSHLSYKDEFSGEYYTTTEIDEINIASIKKEYKKFLKKDEIKI